MKKYLLFTHHKYDSRNTYVLKEFDELYQLHREIEEEKGEGVDHIIAKPITIKVKFEEELQ